MFQKAVLVEFYPIVFRRKIFTTLEKLKKSIYEWLKTYNMQRPQLVIRCYGRHTDEDAPEESALCKKETVGYK